MGRRGPAPTPTSILAARGSRRANSRPGEPRPEAKLPKVPREFNDAAKRVWRAVVKTVAPGVLTIDNGPILSRYVIDLMRWWKLVDWLGENDETYETTDQNGNTTYKRHPNVITFKELGASLLRIEQQLGLTPSARTQVHAAGGATASKGDDKSRFFGGPRLAATA